MKIKQELLDNGFLVYTETQEQYDELMKWLENNTIIKWNSMSNENPTQINSWLSHKNNTIVEVREHTIVFSSFDYYSTYEPDRKIYSFDKIWDSNNKTKTSQIKTFQGATDDEINEWLSENNIAIKDINREFIIERNQFSQQVIKEYLITTIVYDKEV